ncbi:MAG: gamma carbonic anhydrase family protein [Syntrophorhabdaceae bacterium]|nr:gamma carbonic anhydrase family protein [Syntrophorhabdaceae bacterium]
MRAAGNISSFQGKAPDIHESAFIDIFARVIGDVRVEEGVSIWPMAVLRADDSPTLIRRHSAVLDQCLIESPEGSPATVGEFSIISHGAIIHGAVVGPGVLVGVGAIVLDHAIIGAGSIIAAGAIVTPRTVIPANSLVIGSPGTIVRETTPEDREGVRKQVHGLFAKSRLYMKDSSPP